MMSPPVPNEACNDAVVIDRTGPLAAPERRRNPRVPLHWTLYLAFHGSGHPLRTITRDINKDGFYCLLDQPVTPGERFECHIVVPSHLSKDHDDVAYLRCRARAVRVEKVGAGPEFGIACHIEDYRVIHGASVQPLLQQVGNVLSGG